jgi:aldose 1-epimerase
MDLVTLRAGGAALRLAPAAGGTVARYWLERGARVWEWLRASPAEAIRDGDPYLASAFPLVPYSNRIREGRFSFRGRSIRQPLNRPPERHAIHGHGWQAAWRTIEAGATEAVLEYRHDADDWPWSYRATQRFALGPAGLRVELTLTNESASAMPAGIGWHPYFPRTPRSTLTAATGAIWLTDAEMMPTTLAPPPPGADLGRGPTVEALALDNCFVAWSGRARIEWPEWGARLMMAAEPPLDCLVVYTPAGRPFFCAEPVSHVTDAFNLAAAGRADTRMQVLEPGGTLRGVVTLATEVDAA